MNVGRRRHIVDRSVIERRLNYSRNWAEPSLGLPLALALVLAAGSAGCFTTNLNTGATTDQGTQSVLPTFSGTSGNVLTISNVLLDTASPSTTFDIVGDGSGTMGNLCTATSGTGNLGPSTCNCSYSFITSGGTSESFEVPTLYQEADLIRCIYDGVPTSSYVQVSIHVTTSDSYSNQYKYSFSTTASVLDPTNPNSFAVVQRYQCKDVVTVPYLFQGDTTKIYDPLQSENPNLAYPRNFYTTNMGATISLYASQTLTPAWNCPTIPNDPNAGLDLTIYSVGPDSSGSEKIYPPLGSAFDRSTFYVATQPAGVFNVPINSLVVPVLASGVSSGIPSTGYGATPIPAGNGAETCPDTSVAIPTGFQWVKVWLFRADLSPRQFQISNAVNQAQSITCNVLYPDGTPVYPNCNPADVTGGVTTANSTTSPPTLASRVLGELDANGQYLCEDINSACPGGDQGPGCGSTALGGEPIPGADEWREIFIGTVAVPPVFPNPPNGVDPFHVFTNTNVGTPPGGPGYVIPTDTVFTLGNLDAAGQARYDFLFVVTPTSVMSGQMETSSLASNYPYTPFRYLAPEDCVSGDPNNPAFAGDCSSVNIVHYGIKLHDVGTNGDPPAASAANSVVFPVCALQPIAP